MGASRLGIYNGALRWLEEQKLASLTENREPRRYMDDEFEDNALFCVGDGNWNFAMRFVRLNPEQAIIPNFGFNFCFKKPADWNSTFQVSDNEGFNPQLRQWTDQNGYWFANTARLYVKYVSQDENYGLNMGLWTPAFTQYVEARLAWLIAPRLKQKQGLLQRLDRILKKTRDEAISTDSQDTPAQALPAGTWALSRAPRISYELDDGDLPLPGGAQNQQPPPQIIPVIVAEGGAVIETEDGQWIIPEPE